MSLALLETHDPEAAHDGLDCVVIGYNETPFPLYEAMLRAPGVDSLAYRDLRYSFLEIDGRPLTWVDLLNRALVRATPGGHDAEPFCSGDPPNLAAVYLTHFLRRRGLRVEYVNFFQNEKDRLAALLARRPRCVAITTTFYTLNVPLLEMLEFLREVDPGVPIVVGGPLVANHFRRFADADLALALADIGADIYIHESQGEATLAALVACLRDGGDLRDVPNLAFFADGALQLTALEPERNDLDEVAIDWTLFAGEQLGPTLQTRTARSCAFKCSFCAYPMRAGNLTLASIDTIERELDSMQRLGGVRNVVFIDDTFNVPLPRFKDICRRLIARDYGFDWFSYFRCSNSDEEAVELAVRAGCKGVFLGIESGSPSILVNMDKAATLDKYRQGIALLRAHGILTFGSFIIGFPGETEETVAETTAFIQETALDYYRAQLWYCEPGTPIWTQRERWDLTGEGYAWRHRTMTSEEASARIDRLFFDVDRSTWLPQWSFDFWFIPYALGRGLTSEQFREAMRLGHDLLRLDLDPTLPAHRRLVEQHRLLRRLDEAATGWRVLPRSGQPLAVPAPLILGGAGDETFERGEL